MKKICIAVLSIFLAAGCVNQKINSSGQGLIGEVRWVEGNLMPTIGDTTYAERAMGIPIERELFVFMAVTNENTIGAGGTFYKSIQSELVSKVRTDRKGGFKVSLPPGKYSIFVKEEDGFFANSFDGENYINPVTIHANKFTEIQILVNYNAFY